MSAGSTESEQLASTTQTEVSIVIPNWNGADILRACVDSILRHAVGINYEIILVDNGSRDGSVELISQYTAAHEFIRAHYNPENLYFARACNQGYALSSGKYVIISNNDILLTDNSIAEMVAYAANHPSVGIVSPIFIGEDGEFQDFYRRFPRIWHIFATYSKLGRGINKYLLARALQRSYFYKEKTFRDVEEIEEAGASFNLIKREVVERLGFLFDERFSLLFNDVDLYRRVYAISYVSHVISSAKVIHLGSVSSLKLQNELLKQKFYEGLMNYFHKYHRLEHWLLYLVFPKLAFRRLGQVANSLNVRASSLSGAKRQ